MAGGVEREGGRKKERRKEEGTTEDVLVGQGSKSTDRLEYQKGNTVNMRKYMYLSFGI